MMDRRLATPVRRGSLSLGCNGIAIGKVAAAVCVGICSHAKRPASRSLGTQSRLAANKRRGQFEFSTFCLPRGARATAELSDEFTRRHFSLFFGLSLALLASKPENGRTRWPFVAH